MSIIPCLAATARRGDRRFRVAGWRSGVARISGIGQVRISGTRTIGSFSRFESAKQLMAYCGVVPGEHSSGGTRRQGAITKTGNAHVRRVLFESAWAYRHRPNLGGGLKKRQQSADASSIEIALKAQHRLHRRYTALAARGKPMTKIIGALGRELLGFIWAVAIDIETRHQVQQHSQKKAA
jgi:transposase